MKNLQRTIVRTSDGSTSIHLPELNENYHSGHGALQEALHVFIEAGLNALPRKELVVLEIGFGTGLNALLTALATEERKQRVHYVGIEKYPIEEALWRNLNYHTLLPQPNALAIFQELHHVSWDVSQAITAHFELLKKEIDLFDLALNDNNIDLVYYDAFGPRAQGEMWDNVHFEKMYTALKPGGCLVTYCARGQFKRDLRACGFEVESLAGPPGKREMTRAWKR